MPTLSIAIIAHNEEKNLARALSSAAWADEIVFVDCASTDKTAEIAKKFTSKIYHRENNPNLNVNKQFGIEQCSGDWILYLDPDEQITEKLKNEILLKIKNTNTEIKGYSIPRKNYYFGKFLRFGGKYPDYQLRLFKKGFAEFPCKSVHEKICVDGRVSKLNSPMLHYPYIDISDMLKKSNFYTTQKAKSQFDRNKKPIFFFFKPLTKFFRNFVFKLGFLDGFTGFVVCSMDSYNEFISLLKLKEMRNLPSPSLRGAGDLSNKSKEGLGEKK